ncbi:hypothetical protein PSECIP111951_00776 [Pseudoalteromonas holothuriae]|uniref:DUF2947 domain-containing protein n=1 Tax=Pseudoalteromonas holothuriae TaxID=2963714 RepID=A0A9W4QWG3_9GAMM|nr:MULTISPECIES: DUF2947 domain-containing protein [unclassified Pseudoalteromonas]CAH9053213.1 hypothetical protein PSECIP111951_00776 [Pseudoalteromonas sp. CIP111951]CAH9056311.1 hypothetical protein PSECIP111854_01767 [Pseudoalteromonas sp. CIP111854]
MNYISIEEFKKAWVFKHKDLPIDDVDLNAIKLMSAERAAVLWTTMVSREKDHPDFFTQSEWAGDESTWSDSFNWEQPWEAGEPALPQTLCTFLEWEDNTTVYFCLSRKYVFETSFGVFKRCWQNFMFLADGSLLLGKKRQGVIQFLESGHAKLGLRPKG